MDTNDLQKKLCRSAQVVYIFDSEELINEYNTSQKSQLNSKRWQIRDGYGTYPLGMDHASITTATLDAITATRILKELGLNGKAIIRKSNGKSYTIFKGYPGKRSVLKGTRYLSSNPKLVEMAIGKVGVAKAVVKSSVIAFVLYVGINIFEHILDDGSTKAKLFGTLATDVTKLAISSTIGAMAGIAAATVITFAAGPLVIAVGVAILVGWGLNKADECLGITDAFINKLEEAFLALQKEKEELEWSFARFLNQLEREIIWQATGGRGFPYDW